jgi:hypothetical protein
MKTNHAVILASLALLLLSGSRAGAATVYAVKAAGGGNFTTIQSCSNSAVAGDTCEVYAGTYSGWTQNASGVAGSPITFMAHAGDIVTINSGITISSRSYIRVTGFRFSMSSTAVNGNGSTAHNTIDHNTGTVGSLFQIADGLGSNGSDNVVSGNIVVASDAGNNVGIYLYGDRNLIDGNDLKGFDGDCMDLGGMNVVVRNNKCHDLDGSTSGQHIDFIQVIGGGTSPTLSYSLIEGNVEQNCINDGGNCHFVIVRTGTGPVADTLIVRQNFFTNLNDAGGVNVGGVGDSVPNFHFYNNTDATGSLYSGQNSGLCISFQGTVGGGQVLNNIFYKCGGNGLSPSMLPAAENGNIAYNPGYSGSWNSPYSSEPTYASLHNKDPLFANFPTDGSLLSTSPALSGGVALTAVSSTDAGSGTSLVVNDARFFQPGWAGTQGDSIRVGSSTTAQITSINYATNTLTLSTAISRSAGSPVYLYKNSAGTVVLPGSLPAIGAYSGAGGVVISTPTAPTNVRIVP